MPIESEVQQLCVCVCAIESIENQVKCSCMRYDVITMPGNYHALAMLMASFGGRILNVKAFHVG